VGGGDPSITVLFMLARRGFATVRRVCGYFGRWEDSGVKGLVCGEAVVVKRWDGKVRWSC
jgi:hypothetical protein